MKHASKLATAALGLLFAFAAAACAPTADPPPPVDDAAYAVTLSSSALSLVPGDPSLGSATLTAKVLCDGETTDMVPTFTVSDPSVATVDETGKVTAAGHGKTTISATYKDATATAEICVFGKATPEQIAAFSTDAVNLYGRTYKEEGAVHFDNPVTGFEVSFLGDKLTANVTVSEDVFVCIYVDGSTKSDRVRMTTATAFPLAEGLGEGIHTVRVLKSSEVDRGSYSLNALDAPTFLRSQKPGGPKMEFIGDSITAGYGNLVQGGSWSVENSDACASYAYLTAEALDADFSVVALSGICVKADIWGANTNMAELHQYYSLRNKTPYPYDEDTEIVVLNLGTNDGSYLDAHNDYGSQFTADYTAFLTHLREIYPNAYIVCIYGMMGKNGSIELSVKSSVRKISKDDEKIVYLDIFQKNDGGANGHPDGAAHKRYAKQLTDHLLKNVLQ